MTARQPPRGVDGAMPGDDAALARARRRAAADAPRGGDRPPSLLGDAPPAPPQVTQRAAPGATPESGPAGRDAGPDGWSLFRDGTWDRSPAEAGSRGASDGGTAPPAAGGILDWGHGDEARPTGYGDADRSPGFERAYERTGTGRDPDRWAAYERARARASLGHPPPIGADDAPTPTVGAPAVPRPAPTVGRLALDGVPDYGADPYGADPYGADHHSTDPYGADASADLTRRSGGAPPRGRADGFPRPDGSTGGPEAALDGDANGHGVGRYGFGAYATERHGTGRHGTGRHGAGRHEAGPFGTGSFGTGSERADRRDGRAGAELNAAAPPSLAAVRREATLREAAARAVCTREASTREAAELAQRAPTPREATGIRNALDALVPFVDGARGRAGFGERILVALAGPPAAGKSTIAAALAQRLGDNAVALPMDGFQLDNAVLDERGLRSRKGAPATFDIAGFAATLARVRSDRGAVLVPVYDRRLDLARAGGREIASHHRTILVEGSYLLLNEAPWSAIARLFDATVFLRVPESVIEERILARWRRYGLDERAARSRALENDVPNASLVIRNSSAADITLDERGWPSGGEAA